MDFTETAAMMISIHAPPRGATQGEGWHDRADCISIHAPPRGATFIEIAKQCAEYEFQFTPLREGRQYAIDGGIGADGHFNSRPSARGDYRDCKTMRGIRISIHAPPRGATMLQKLFPGFLQHFNSRPSARGDLSPILRFKCKREFQFTPLREGRRCNQLRKRKNRAISIHAPPRGATAKDMQFLQIFCSTLTNQHGLTIMPRNLSRLFW